MSTLATLWPALVGGLVGVVPSLLLSRRLLRIERLSLCDPLTGLRSGRLLDQDVDLLSRSGPVALLLIDLDNFRRFNEFGYREGGDRALVTAAARIVAACRRRSDRVYRLHTAGDEFAVLTTPDDEQAAHETAKLICAALRDNATPASIGVAFCDGSIDPRASELLAEAAANKEKAKKAGKDRVFPPRFDEPPPPAVPTEQTTELTTFHVVPIVGGALA